MAQVALELQPCCGNRSGIGIYAYELAKRLINDEKLNFSGNLFNFLGKNDVKELFLNIKFPIYTQECLPYGLYRRIWNFIPVNYSTMFPKADLNIFFNYIVPPKISGKVINTICDVTYLRFPESMNEKNLSRITKNIDYSIERSDSIITISEFSKNEISELLKVSKEKISVIYCAPSFSEYKVDFVKIKNKYKISSPYLLYVGTIEPRKNIVRLVKSFELLKKNFNLPHKLVLAGSVGWKTENIIKTINKSSFRDDIILTGYISEEEKNTLYTNSEIFVFPSLYEGFGIPPLEAMHFGCPVVCSNVASLPEIVGEAAELVNPFDEITIAEGIIKVLNNKNYRSKLIESGYIQEQKFSWDESALRLKLLCDEVLEND